MYEGKRVVVVVPAHNESAHVGGVLREIPDFVDSIIVVDDGSRDGTSEAALAVEDDRVTLLRHERPQGVGGATTAGIELALRNGAELVVKIDADGQMNPLHMSVLLQALLAQGYGYAKGNRFLNTAALRRMPKHRLVGNLALTFLTKLASGYWKVFDPQNGYVAARAEVLRQLDMSKLAKGFFFENDLLIHLNVLDVKVTDVAMPARYGEEESSVRLAQVLITFPFALLRGFWYRIYQKYILRDFSPIAVFWCLGTPLLLWGVVFGAATWIRSYLTGEPATTGTVMLSVLPFLLGFQLTLQAINLEIQESSR